MPFHLDVDTGKSSEPISHNQSVLLIGSCFTEHIQKRLSDFKFDCRANPFGIVFNPMSVALMLERIMERRLFTETDVILNNDTWLCLETHTQFTESSQSDLLLRLNAVVEEWHNHLKQAQWLIITFGSAFYYEYDETKRIVANCHKLPANVFSKIMASPLVIETAYRSLLTKLSHFNPSLKTIFTISPVKHLRDGVVENNISKASLILSAHEIVKQNPQCSYFPSYELVNDDLRDYRFYEADMAHPNQQAIDYVWQKFSGTYFNSATQTLAEKIGELTRAFNHRPLRADTKAHHNFKGLQLQKCIELKNSFPYLNFEKEIQHFS